MKIIKEQIKNIELDFFNQDDLRQFSYLKNMNEHYRFLVYVSYLYNNEQLLDLGTAQGHSCLSLSQNQNNKVITYDIEPKNHVDFIKYPNIEVKTLDINKEDAAIINASKFISLDIDPHDGEQELVFYKKLIDINYKGIVICDDININQGMKDFWNSVTHEKYDITEVGHWSGTGLINFSDEKIEIL
jgi:hypothetical protein